MVAHVENYSGVELVNNFVIGHQNSVAGFSKNLETKEIHLPGHLTEMSFGQRKPWAFYLPLIFVI